MQWEWTQRLRQTCPLLDDSCRLWITHTPIATAADDAPMSDLPPGRHIVTLFIKRTWAEGSPQGIKAAGLDIAVRRHTESVQAWQDEVLFGALSERLRSPLGSLLLLRLSLMRADVAGPRQDQDAAVMAGIAAAEARPSPSGLLCFATLGPVPVAFTAEVVALSRPTLRSLRLDGCFILDARDYTLAALLEGARHVDDLSLLAHDDASGLIEECSALDCVARLLAVKPCPLRHVAAVRTEFDQIRSGDSTAAQCFSGFISALGDNCSVQSVDISRSALDDEATAILATALAVRHKPLEALSLVGCQVGGAGAQRPPRPAAWLIGRSL